MRASLPHYFIGIPIPADIAEPIWEAYQKGAGVIIQKMGAPA